MFEKHFQLHRRPFPSVPSSDRYFPAAGIDRARAGLVRLIEREQGPGLVIGSTGIGKTMLCRLLDESFRQRYRVVCLATGRLDSRRALLQTVLYELGQPYRDMEEGELRLTLIDHATDKDLCPQGILILVDGAESLALPLMDELRTMTDLMSGGASCIRLVLFGNNRLEEKFAHPRLESFNQRIAGRFYLDSLTREESRQFVEQQIRDSGGHPETIVADEAFDTIFQATEGIPRLINQLCDHALILAAIDGIHQLNSRHFERAWADLQQLPMPKLEIRSATEQSGTEQSGTEQSGTEQSATEQSVAEDGIVPDIVEFGSLDDNSESVDVGSDAQVKIDEIERHILHTQSDAADSRSSVAKPEVALILHNSDATHDPFDEPFEEEEVVIDQYVTPDAISHRDERSVSCDESQAIAGQLDGMLRHLSGADAPQPVDHAKSSADHAPLTLPTTSDVRAVSDPSTSDPSTSHETPLLTAYDPTDMVHEQIEWIVESPSADEKHEPDPPATSVPSDEPFEEHAEDQHVGISVGEHIPELPLADEAEDDVENEAIDVTPIESSTPRDTYRNLFTRLRQTHD